MLAGRMGAALLCSVAFGMSGQAQAQQAAPGPLLPVDFVAADPLAGLPPPPLPAATITIPALTPLTVEVMATLSSKLSRTGEMFPIRLSAPIVIGGVVAVPAGTSGMGEVIHAKKSGGSGAAGELIAAARYLEIDGRRMNLRSFQLSITGRDQTNLALASSSAISFLAFAITGKNTEIPQGIHATAKVTKDFIVLPPPTPGEVAPIVEGESK